MLDINKIYQGNVLDIIKNIDNESIDSVITSPPYWQLRDYGYPEQWGLESTYEEYLEHLWSLIDEVFRILKQKGTVWVNLGDTYGGNNSRASNNGRAEFGNPREAIVNRGVSKCLTLIPHRFAIGCIERGWILRNDIIWAKRNGMPESIKDRFSKKHEYFFFMVKNEKYYFDMDNIKDKKYQTSILREQRGSSCNNKYAKANSEIVGGAHSLSKSKSNDPGRIVNVGKNPGDVSDFWDIPTNPSSKKHYASYNFKLIDKPIVSGCPENGIILDPFCGTGTTLKRALQLNRKIIGIDGSLEYCEMAKDNIKPELTQQQIKF